jgi:hypothetical protein
MTAPGAGCAETPQQFGRVEGAAVDIGGERREFLSRDGSDRIGDRWRRKIVVFDHR